jgi:hypothetical protein
MNGLQTISSLFILLLCVEVLVEFRGVLAVQVGIVRHGTWFRGFQSLAPMSNFVCCMWYEFGVSRQRVHGTVPVQLARVERHYHSGSLNVLRWRSVCLRAGVQQYKLRTRSISHLVPTSPCRYNVRGCGERLIGAR